MFITQLFLLTLLALFAAAAPEQKCKKDKCYAAVSSAPAARSDCTSFQRAYVTPCAETRTRTITITRTVSSPPSGTQTITYTEYDSVVKTVTTTSTQTVTVTTKPPAGYPRDMQARATTSCSGLTVKPTATPKYASVCSSSQGFASACSCFGVPPATTTLFPATSTSTVFTEYTTTVGGGIVTTSETTTITTTGTITATQTAATTVTVTRK